jgi:hypothetical protein
VQEKGWPATSVKKHGFAKLSEAEDTFFDALSGLEVRDGEFGRNGI